MLCMLRRTAPRPAAVKLTHMRCCLLATVPLMAAAPGSTQHPAATAWKTYVARFLMRTTLCWYTSMLLALRGPHQRALAASLSSTSTGIPSSFFSCGRRLMTCKDKNIARIRIAVPWFLTKKLGAKEAAAQHAILYSALGIRIPFIPDRSLNQLVLGDERVLCAKMLDNVVNVSNCSHEQRARTESEQ